MGRKLVRTALGSSFLLAICLALFAATASAEIVPLRSGTVISKADTGVFSYIKAVDDQGKEFWVLTSICTIGEKGRIAVLAGAHYDQVRLQEPDMVLKDVYTAQLMKVGDVEVPGFGAHGLPKGCVTLR